jgi:hypothetical protein
MSMCRSRVNLLTAAALRRVGQGMPMRAGSAMSRSGMYVVIGVLVVLLVGFGVYFYNEQTKPGVSVKVDSQGLSIKGNG